MVERLLTAWNDLRGSMRWLLSRDPREGTLLAMAMASGVIAFLGRAGALWLSPEAAELGEAALRGRLQNELAAALFFRTLMLYLVAGLAGLVARAFGGHGSWKASRAATFWAALLAAPVLAAGELLAAPLPPLAALAAAVLAQLAFAWAFAACFAEAHGFASVPRVLAVVLVAGLVLLLPLAFLG